MSFALIDLPYPEDALEPVISARTLSFHYGKHHRAYVEKTNKAIEGTEHDDIAVEALISATRGSDPTLFNNAAQSWNHAFYWHSLAPEGGHPSDELKAMIDADFGSLDELEKQLSSAGAGHFASGWVWLVEQGGHLRIIDTHDAETLADGDGNPLLVLDVWEHAYYLDHQNDRGAYLEQVIEKHLNWRFASDNLVRGKVWKYPA